MENNEKRQVLMKLEIPFCVRQCSFCARRITPGRSTPLIHNYIMALAMELKANAAEFQDCRIRAIRFGGGSASIMSGNDFNQLCRMIHEFYDVQENVPLTMLVSPSDINGANMPFYNRCHVTRYDLEMISLEPEDFIHLDYLNYMEQLPYISSGFLRADRRPVMGFVLLYGKKTISRWGFRRSVLGTVRRHVSHLTLMRCAGADALDDAAAQAQLDEAAEILREHGFTEYLPQHWAREGCEDVFLMEKAAGMEVLGFGLGAQTRFDGVVSTNTDQMDTYLRYSGQYDKITANVQRCAAPSGEQ